MGAITAPVFRHNVADKVNLGASRLLPWRRDTHARQRDCCFHRTFCIHGELRSGLVPLRASVPTASFSIL